MKKNGHTMGNSSGDLMSPLEICGFSRWQDPHIGAGLNQRNTTQQLPLAVAQLLIKHIPPFRTMCNSNAMAITPVLHTHRHPPHPSEPTRSCPHFLDMPPDVLPMCSWSSCSCWTWSTLEVFGKWYLIGWLLARLLPVP